MQIQVGEFRFEAPAEYRELGRRRSRRWAARERHGLPPVLEDLGRDADTITLTGSVWVRTRRDLDAFAVLLRQAGLAAGEDAEPLPVFMGGGDMSSGDYLGLWVVELLHTRDRDLRLENVPARIEFSCRLREHVEAAVEA